MARVTVVVSTYNKRESVVEALESVLAQSYTECDVVIVDDGSTDGTPAYLLARCGAHPKTQRLVAGMNPGAMRSFSCVWSVNGTSLLYHYQPNRGLSAARNWGICASRSRYLAFLEAEDTWEPQHLATHMRFHLSRAGAVATYVGERTARGMSRAATARDAGGPSGWIFEHLLESSPISLSSVLVPRGCLGVCGSFDENLEACEDYDLWLRLALRFPFYRLDGTSIIRRSPRREPSQRSWSWERFRVYALEKAFQGGSLDGRQRLLVAQELAHKCERLADGYQRTKNAERASFYERKRKRFAIEVRKLRDQQAAQVQH